MYYVYILRNINDKSDFYLGYTSDIERRIFEHNIGKNKSTKNKEWELVYYESYTTINAARKREYRLKHDGRVKKYLMDRIKEDLK